MREWHIWKCSTDSCEFLVCGMIFLIHGDHFGNLLWINVDFNTVVDNGIDSFMDRKKPNWRLEDPRNDNVFRLKFGGYIKPIYT